MKFNNCITSSEDLVTSRAQTRAGFIEAALEKNRRSKPYIEEAKTYANNVPTFTASAPDNIEVDTHVVLECKLYTTAPVDSLANIELFISPDDFKVETIDLRGNLWQKEHRYGKNYQMVVFRKLLLYPLRTGELRIGNLHVDAYIRKVDETIDPFDAFFNDGNAVSVKERVHCTGITLHVHE